ncbi:MULTISPECIES: ATP-dependent DNA helicase [Paenibacillus]|uniref:ATP-dependent DNA helicase n=1 Tax=Paenibacillus TaxID=44249 RepID=UPI0022B8B060|nr:ATP-dependent DNA helicase [Paenibacillus caseinilyticus]MCZ8521200.1 ATP-dependent DNA helicase [Paenibacillus caseinilyticus]
MERYPFAFDPSRPFTEQVGEWVADVFYDILPEAGFEVRDEQIYMAFQLERAYADKEIIFAEAGVGTGKTLAYLLYAVCYARYTRKPAVIACADESLIEQLVKPGGDIAKLAEHLNLVIDARLGKSPDQYLCLMKLDEARFQDEDGELFEEVYEGLPDFTRSNAAMQSFHPYGDRKHYPHLNDGQWNKIGWDTFQDCFVCEKRHRCGQTLSRDHYRRSPDVIICSHDFYMEHVWTADSRKREGQLPLLPEHSSVVFDEGHLLETAAQKALTYKLKHAVFEELITRLLQGEIRETLAVLIDEAIDTSEMLFRELSRASTPVPGTERMRIELVPELLREVRALRSVLTAIEEELVFEGELYTLNEYQLRIVEEHLEMMQRALVLFDSPDTLICWAEGSGNALTLSIMPRTVKEVLGEQVFTAKMPVVFSSATLSVDGSFDYMAESLGIGKYRSFSVPSPYDYEHQMEAIYPRWREGGRFEEKLDMAVRLLERTAGRALLLFPTREELRRFKSEIGRYPACGALRFLYEGDAEISHLIEAFQSDEESVLCAVSLWEGLDVPGPALSNVIIWSLPFPPQDPVFMVKRSASASPFEEVELPYMLLRLRQGMGRLIRSREDRGIVAVFAEDRPEEGAIRARIEAVLPTGVLLQELQAGQGAKS